MASRESPDAVVCSGCLWGGRSLLYCMRQVLLSYVCVFVGGGSRFSNGIIIIMSHNINPLYFAAGSCVAMYCSYI